MRPLYERQRAAHETVTGPPLKTDHGLKTRAALLMGLWSKHNGHRCEEHAWGYVMVICQGEMSIYD